MQKVKQESLIQEWLYLTFHERTRRPLSNEIFSAKNVTHQQRFEPTTSCLPGRRTTNCAMVTRISKLVFTKWSNEVQIWQNLKKKTKQRL